MSADYLREIREELGLTQDEVAVAADMRREHVCRIENGRKVVGIVNLDKLVGVLGMTLREFFNRLG